MLWGALEPVPAKAAATAPRAELSQSVSCKVAVASVRKGQVGIAADAEAERGRDDEVTLIILCKH